MNALQDYLLGEMIEEYQDGRMSGRELLRQAEAIAGGAAAALVELEKAHLSVAELWVRDEAPVPPRNEVSRAPEGVTISPDDPEISASPIDYQGEAGTMLAYIARPRALGRYPGVIVIHENRGLVPHIRDVARRVAKAGYVALAPDLVSRVGGTDKFPDPADFRGALSSIPPEAFMADLGASLDHLKSMPFVQNDRLGCVGFCFGGGLTWRFSTKRPDLRAAVPFYGPAPALEDVPNIKAAMLGIYGGLDERINAGIPALEETMKTAGIRYEIVVYPGAAHAFHNDTGANYHPEAAREAWARTLAHFATHLKGTTVG